MIKQRIFHFVIMEFSRQDMHRVKEFSVAERKVIHQSNAVCLPIESSTPSPLSKGADKSSRRLVEHEMENLDISS